MRLARRFLVATLALAGGCGGANPGDESSNDPTALNRTYELKCTIDDVLLEMTFDVSFELDRPYASGQASELTVGVTAGFTESTVAALIAAGIRTVDVISAEVITSIRGASPSTLAVVLAEAPINDFDLEIDTDQNGIPGPRLLGLRPTTLSSTADANAAEVELLLSLDGISILLGDVDVPTDCVDPSLVGLSATFPVEPATPP